MRYVVAGAGLLLLAACVSTNAVVLNPTAQYTRICPAGVELFTSSDKVGKEYTEVAVLNSKGESGWTNEEQMFESQRKKAADLGANGIILTGVKEPGAGAKIMGALFGTGSERKGGATAIYIPGDSARVREACPAVGDSARAGSQPAAAG